MARPAKQGLDYFPLDVGFLGDDKVMEITRGCGPKGPTVLIALMCSIYSQGYCEVWGDKMARRIAGRAGVGAAFAREVVHKAVQADFFDKDLFHAHGVLTSEGIQRRYAEAKKLKGPGGGALAPRGVFSAETRRTGGFFGKNPTK